METCAAIQRPHATERVHPHHIIKPATHQLVRTLTVSYIRIRRPKILGHEAQGRLGSQRANGGAVSSRSFESDGEYEKPESVFS